VHDLAWCQQRCQMVVGCRRHRAGEELGTVEVRNGIAGSGESEAVVAVLGRCEHAACLDLGDVGGVGVLHPQQLARVAVLVAEHRPVRVAQSHAHTRRAVDGIARLVATEGAKSFVDDGAGGRDELHARTERRGEAVEWRHDVRR
jgi:hypothetical protein